jgi:cell division protein ZapA
VFQLKKRFQIKILGQDIAVFSDSGDEHVASVVRYVNQKAEEIGKSSNDGNVLQIAILAALNIADEYFKNNNMREETYEQLETRSEKLIELINGIRPQRN